jgi:predicted transcriptional regulator
MNYLSIYYRLDNAKSMAKERRTRIQLYFDIISAIFEEEMDNETISPTRIQFKCNTSYDKLTKYLEEMKNKEIIEGNEIKVTEKGKQFHKDYSKINELIQELSIQN